MNISNNLQTDNTRSVIADYRPGRTKPSPKYGSSKTIPLPKQGHRIRLAFYIRVSQSTDESDSKTIETQEQRMIEAADVCYGKGEYDYVVFIDDGVSGGLGSRKTKSKRRIRPAFAQMEKEILANGFDAVFIYSIDRLARSVEVFCSFVNDVILPTDTGLISATENIDLNSAMGRATAEFMAVFAGLYREKGSERVCDAMSSRRKLGFTLGHISYGWQRSKVPIVAPGGDRARYGIEPDELARPIVLEIAEKFLAGHNLKTITADLNDRGIAAPCLNEAYRNRRSHDQAWNIDAVCRVLTNPNHAGLVSDTEGNLVPGIHYNYRFYEIAYYERIMERRQARMKRKTNSRRINNRHILNGTVKCHRCGHRLNICYGAKDKGTGKYPYQFHSCKNGLNRGEKTCPGVSVRVEALEVAVVAQVLQLAARSDMLELVRQEAERELSRQSNGQGQRGNVLQQRLAELNHNRRELIRSLSLSLEKGLIEEEDFRQEKETFDKEINGVRSQIERLENEQNQEANINKQVKQVEYALENLEAGWEKLSFDEKREILDLLVEDLRVDRQQRDITVYLKLVLCPAVEIPLLVDVMRTAAQKPTGIASLTHRQLAVLYHHAQGLTGPETAKAMDISEGCLFAARTEIRKRLGLKDLNEATALARERIATLESTLPLGPTARSQQKVEAPLLSPKLLEVLKPLTEGATPAEIAQESELSIPVVCTRRQSILQRLGVKTVREAGQKARELGLL